MLDRSFHSRERDGLFLRVDGPSAWFACALIASAITLVYGGALNAPFIYDDDPAILRNPSIDSIWPLVGTIEQPGPLNPPRNLPTSARPLVNFSFALNHCFGGENPRGYHVVNVVIHMLS